MRKAVVYILVFCALLFMASYIQARYASQIYLDIMTIRDEESYQRVKK